MVGISREEEARQLHLWRKDAARHEPIERHGVRIMSVGFLIGERQALTIGAPLLGAVSHLPQGDWRIGSCFYLCSALQLAALVLAWLHFRGVRRARHAARATAGSSV